MSEYIDRQSLINHLNQSAAEYYSRAVERVIELEPAADVAPVRRGQWVRVGNGTTCSECMQGLLRINGKQSEWVDLSGMPYCPNCGAKMEVQNEHPG
jgi:hypothetical protein